MSSDVPEVDNRIRVCIEHEVKNGQEVKTLEHNQSGAIIFADSQQLRNDMLTALQPKVEHSISEDTRATRDYEFMHRETHIRQGTPDDHIIGVL